MNMIISVTKEDIIKGNRGSADRCPVALAFKRALLPKQSKIAVGSQTFSVRIKGHYSQGDLPARAIRFIRRFDSSESVKPFTFALDI